MAMKQFSVGFLTILLLLGMANFCEAEQSLAPTKAWSDLSATESVKQNETGEPLPFATTDNKNADYSGLAAKIADSMKNFLPKNIKNIALWRIDGNWFVGVDIDALRDSMEIAIVKGRQLSLIDRTKLNVIFKEQGLSQTGLVDPAKMKKIGKLYGLDAIVFVEILSNKIDKIENVTVIVKAIDTETGLLSYSAEFPIEDKYMKTEIDDLCGRFINSISSDKQAIIKDGVDTIAFWQIDAGQSGVDTSVLISKLSNYLKNSKTFKIIDRDNLKELLNEQTFGTTGLVDAATAKRLGKLYGVDAFIFGSAKDWEQSGNDDVLTTTIRVNLKMIDVNTAKIIWADELQGNFEKSRPEIYAFFGKEVPQEESWVIPAAKSAVIPGWGQRDNGQEEKGNAFLSWEILTVGVGYYAHTQYRSAWNNYMGATTRSDMDKYYSEANTYHNIRTWCIYLAAGIWLYNIYDAGVNCNALKTSSVYILPQEDKMLVGARVIF